METYENFAYPGEGAATPPGPAQLQSCLMISLFLDQLRHLKLGSPSLGHTSGEAPDLGALPPGPWNMHRDLAFALILLFSSTLRFLRGKLRGFFIMYIWSLLPQSKAAARFGEGPQHSAALALNRCSKNTFRYCVFSFWIVSVQEAG